jgi:hypothetical protein
MGERELDRVRRIVLALPGVSERESHGAICFFIGGRRPLCYFHDNHRGDGRIALWCPLPLGTREELVVAEPERFFRPAASASGTYSSWLGAYLDTPSQGEVEWDELAAIIRDAYRHIATRKFVAEIERGTEGTE